MKSIWSRSYAVVTFSGKENQTNSMPNRFEQVKTVNRKAFVQKTDSSSQKTVLTENFEHKNTVRTITKRKLVESNNYSDYDESSGENKKCKTDIDDLLSKSNNA
jgi:hypothetical protein